MMYRYLTSVRNVGLRKSTIHPFHRWISRFSSFGEVNDQIEWDDDHLSERSSWRNPCERPDLSEKLFDLLKERRTDEVSIARLFSIIKSVGIEASDARFTPFLKNIKHLLNSPVVFTSLGEAIHTFEGIQLNKEDFIKCIDGSRELVARCIMNDMAIGDWQGLTELVEVLYKNCKKNHKGTAKKHFSKMSPPDPTSWGVSLCSIDGQRQSFGDSSIPVCLQAAQFPFSYSLALSDTSENYVHRYVGHEPSGLPSATPSLNSNNVPHNPMLNSGAIVIASILQKEKSAADRFDYVLSNYRRFTGNEFARFNNAAFLAERASSHFNFAIGYVLKEAKGFPEGNNFQDVMDLFYQMGSIEMTCRSASVAAATLANGGICPITKERVVSNAACRATLSLMYSCGMYDYSGQFAFKDPKDTPEEVGLPAKSSTSGLILLIVPNVMGVALYSPKLNHFGISSRSVQFCEELVKYVNYHNYDSLVNTTSVTRDVTHKEYFRRSNDIYVMLFAAFQNDVTALRWEHMRGADLNKTDYDSRTPLHVAAAEGHLESVRFLLEVARVNPEPLDRWNHSPLADAEQFGRESVIDFLKKYPALVVDAKPLPTV